MIRIIPIVICLCACTRLTAQPADTIVQKLDAYLSAAHLAGRFNGNALVAREGQILLQKSYGYRNVAEHLSNDSTTIFQIGSVTKQFTAAVILELQEEGKLSVTDRLDRYFPQYRYARDITIENLLTHSSGLYDYTSDIDASDSAQACRPVSQQVVLDIIFKHKLSFRPGTQMQYCNSGYYLLGLIIEKVTGKSYEQNIHDRVFTPLQMNHSLFDFNPSADRKIATGYQTLNDTIQKVASAWRWDSTVTFAAGGIWSTTGDLYRWMLAMRDHEILTPGSWREMMQRRLDHYGYGLYIDSLYGTPEIYHGGGIPGFSANLCYYPEKDVMIILLSNVGWFDQSLDPVNTDLSAILFHFPYELMRNTTGTQFPDSVLHRYVGRYDFDRKHHAYVTLENHQLMIEAPQGGLPRSPLFAEDDKNFYLKIINARIEFIKGSDGTITGLISHYRGKQETCIKVR